MADTSYDKHLDLLINVAGQVDPSVQASVIRTIDFLNLLGKAQEDILRSAKATATALNPEVTKQYTQALAQVSGQFQSMGQTATPATQAVNQLAQAQQTQTQATQQQASAFTQVNSSMQNFLTTVTAIASGNILADMFKSAMGAAKDFFTSLGSDAKDFAKDVLGIVSTMSIAKEQIAILFQNKSDPGLGRQQAADAVEAARRNALEAPFIDFQESLTAIRQLTAAGLDYNRWLVTVQNISALTANSLDDIKQRMTAVTRAIAEIAAGATGRGINALRMMGINMREAGIEFDKTGKAMGSTEEILAKLETHLNNLSAGGLSKLNNTLPAIQQNFEDLSKQLKEAFFTPVFQPLIDSAAKFFDTIKTRAPEIRAFAAVLGEGLGSQIQGFVDIVQQGGEQLAGGTNWYDAGAKLVLSFADGILAGGVYVIQVIADLAAAVASFLVGLSPPPEGPLSTIDDGGENIVNAWAEGIERGAPAAVAAATRVAGATSRALSSARGIYGPNLADQFGGGGVAEMLGKALPAINGVLSQIRLAGVESATAYLDGFRTGFDLSPIQKIMSAVEAVLKYGVDTKQIAQSSVGSYVSDLTELLYRAALEVQEFGAVTQTTLDSVNANFGLLADNVTRILDLMGALSSINAQIANAQAAVQGAQDAVQAAEQGVKAAEAIVKSYQTAVDAAQAVVKAIQDQIDGVQLQIKAFELATAEIPERFTRGRRREYDVVLLRLEQEKSLKELTVEAAQEQVKAAQAQVQAARDIVELRRLDVQAAQKLVQQLNAQKTATQDLLKLEQAKLDATLKAIQAADQAAKAAKAAGAGDERGFFEGIGNASSGLAAKFEELKASTRDWLKTIAGPQIESIINHFETLKTILKDIFGLQAETPIGGDTGDADRGVGLGGLSTGAKIRASLLEIHDNLFKIGVIGAEAWHKVVSAFFDFKQIWDDFFTDAKTESDVTTGLVIPKEGAGTKARQLFEDIKKAIEAIKVSSKGIFSFLDDGQKKWDALPQPMKDFLGGSGQVAAPAGPAIAGPPAPPTSAWEGLTKTLKDMGDLDIFGILREFGTITLPDIGKKVGGVVSGLTDFFGMLTAPMPMTLPDQMESFFGGFFTTIHNGELAWNTFWEGVALSVITNLQKGELAWNTFWDNVAIAAYLQLGNLTIFINGKWDALVEFGKKKWQEWDTAYRKWEKDAEDIIAHWATHLMAEVFRAIEYAKKKIDEWQTAIDTFFKNLIQAVTDKLAEFSRIIGEKQAEILQNWNTLWNALTNSGPFLAFKKAIGDILGLLEKVANFRLPSLPGQPQTPNPDPAVTPDPPATPDPDPPQAPGGPRASGGVIFKTAQYLLHRGEVVLNESQQMAIMSAIKAPSTQNFQGMQPVHIEINQTFDGTPSLETRLQIQREMRATAYKAITDSFARR